MELQEYLDEVQPVESGFTVDTEEKANWALRKIRQFKEKQEANTKLAQSEISRIQEWQAKENGTLADSIKFFEGLLQGYAEKQREADPKFKSVKLPYGVMRFKKQQPKFEPKDEVLVPFLEELKIDKDFVKTEKTTKWGDLKKACNIVEKDGKIKVIYQGIEVPVEAKKQDDKFEVEV